MRATSIATTGFVVAAIAAKKVINLTDKRIEALRWLATLKEPVYVCGLAEQCIPRDRLFEHSTRQLSRTAQMATRAGAGYAIPLIKAGLVKYHRKTYGWGQVSITPEGRKVLAAFDRDDGSLQGELERAKIVGDSREHPWVGK